MTGRRKIEFYAAAGHAGHKITPKKEDTQSAVFRASAVQAYLHAISEMFVAGIQKIQETYKAEKQGEQIQKLADELLLKMQKDVKGFLDPLRIMFDGVAGKVAGLLKGPNYFSDAVMAVNKSELRTFIRSLEMKERIELLNRAAENGDDEVMVAFTEKSQIFRLADPAYIESKKQIWLTKKYPALAEEFLATETAGSVLASDFESITQDLAAYASPQPDRINAIIKSIPKPGWTNSETNDSRFINSRVMETMLPPPGNNPVQSVEERLAATNKK